METKKFDFFHKSMKLNLDLCRRAEITLALSIAINPTLVIDTSMERSLQVLQHGNLKIWIFFKSVRNWLNWILSVPRVSVRREKKLPWLRQYQSYISNWHINEKVFMSTTAWKPNNLKKISKKFEIDKIEFCPYPEFLYPEKRNRPGFVNVSPT